MTVRIHNIGKWSRLEPGELLALRGDHTRKVRLEVNCPAPTRLDVVVGDKATFLGVVQGHEVLEFVADADAYVQPTSEDEVWYFTNDGDEIAVSRPEAVSFTTIANRRARNPELERMMQKMERNIMHRLAIENDQREAHERRKAEAEARRRAAEAEAAGADTETGEVVQDAERAAASEPDSGETAPTAKVASRAKAKGEATDGTATA